MYYIIDINDDDNDDNIRILIAELHKELKE